MARKRRCRQNGPREKAVLIRVDDDEKRMLQDAARRRNTRVPSFVAHGCSHR